MVIRTFFDKNNTMVSNSDVNTGLNPVTEIFYGGPVGEQKYSRYLFHFDESRLVSLYTGGTFTDLSKLKHTLRMTNTNTFDTTLLNGTYAGKDKASSFDLICFKVNQDWDNGVGYDFEIPIVLNGQVAYSNVPSNWVNSSTGIAWANGTGVYSGSPSGITVSTQHFDLGNENLEMDVTNYVNGLLTGDTNYGLGIAYNRPYELMNTTRLKYVGFFTRNTQTFYEPYIETTYDSHIIDDRNNFYLGNNNKLYLYVNINGNPTNLDTNPSVDIYDSSGGLFTSFTPTQVNHETLGVYSISLMIPDGGNYDEFYIDEWKGLVINGITRPDLQLKFLTKDPTDYYGFGNDVMLPKKIALNVSGIQNKEKIKRGDIRKVIVSARIPYTVEQTQFISGLKYRLYVLEGVDEYTITDFEPIEMANHYYFLIDTASLIPNNYYIDVLVSSNLEVTTLKNVLEFEVINQVELRKS
jgi:hypothetical protein